MSLHRPSHNPKAPHVRRSMSSEIVAPLEAFVERLQRLGAAPDVVDEVRVQWNDPAWTHEDRTMIMGLSDSALTAELVSIEREYREATTTPEEDEAQRAAEHAAAEILPEDWRVVIAWMRREDQMARATAVEALETKRQRPRVSVLNAAAEIIDAA